MQVANVEDFRIPICVPMRIFSLEFTRQSLNVDQIHFAPVKNGHLFKLPRTVGPLIVNTIQSIEEAQKMLNDMHLLLEDKWAYDPYHVISNRRLENGYSPFVHESRLEVKKLENGGLISTSVQMEVENPHPTEKGHKRGREELFDLESDVENEAKKTEIVEESSSSVMPIYS